MRKPLLLQDRITLSEAWRRVVAAMKRRSLARATYLSLRELDPHMLRDLGFNHSELLSVAAEIAGETEPTRVRLVQALRGPR